MQTVNNLLFFMSNIWLIVAREFNERVRKKSFIVTTLLMPVLMLGLMLAPALMMRYASGQTKTCLLYTSPSPRDRTRSRMPSSA